MIAALLLTPAHLSAKPASEFTIEIVAAAGTSTIGTVEARLAFDPSLLTAEKFSLAPGWVAVAEPGYVSLDNRKGAVVETAGYPGGFTGTTTLGTITFAAKNAGAATLALAGTSLMLDAANQNEFGAANGSTVTIGSIVLAPVPHAPPSIPTVPVAAAPAHAVIVAPAALAASASLAAPGLFSRIGLWLHHLHL